MFTIYIVITMLLFCGCRICRTGSFNDGYISKGQCNCVKGFFIVVVFCRHIAPYLADAGYDFSLAGDNLFRSIDGGIGQLLVVMFLFYSGYGVMESVKRKGREYVDAIPRRRVLTTLANFDVAVLLFLVVDLCLDIDYPAENVVLSFTGWESIGNSNWYIFLIMCCYMSTYITFRLSPRNRISRMLIGGGNLCIIACIYMLLLFTKQGWWYDTIFSYPLGVCYSLYKIEIENFVKRYYTVVLCLSVLVFAILMCFCFSMKGLYANMRGSAMAVLIVVLSMKIKIDSKPLAWLGRNLFPLYIYQRIGMIVLGNIDGGHFITVLQYVYIACCVGLTLLFGWSYKFIQINIKG